MPDGAAAVDAGDGPASGSDVACTPAGGDAGPAALVAADQGKVIFTEGASALFKTTAASFRAYFTRAGQFVYPTAGAEDMALVGAGYFTSPPGVCGLATIGPCTVASTSCALPPPPCASPQAGPLSLTGPSLPSAQLAPNPDGTYTTNEILATNSVPFFAAGDALMVSAAGGDVPAFQATVSGPSCLALTAPAIPAGGTSYAIPTAQDLAVAWTGGQPDATVGVDLIWRSTVGTVAYASCTFPASDGQGTIPKEALASFVAGPGGFLTVYQQKSATTQAGSFAIEIDVRNLGGGGMQPDGSTCPPNNGYVEYQ
jgi:hypothetical protein